MTEQKYILVEDGWGTQKWIRKLWGEAQKQYEKFRKMAVKWNCGQEIIEKYHLWIVRERE